MVKRKYIWRWQQKQKKKKMRKFALKKFSTAVKKISSKNQKKKKLKRRHVIETWQRGEIFFFFLLSFFAYSYAILWSHIGFFLPLLFTFAFFVYIFACQNQDRKMFFLNKINENGNTQIGHHWQHGFDIIFVFFFFCCSFRVLFWQREALIFFLFTSIQWIVLIENISFIYWQIDVKINTIFNDINQHKKRVALDCFILFFIIINFDKSYR